MRSEEKNKNKNFASVFKILMKEEKERRMKWL